jgi:hypothetical protein
MNNLIADAYHAYCVGQRAAVHPQENLILVRRLMSALRMEFPSTLAEYEVLSDQLLCIWQQYVGCTDPQDFEFFRTSGTTRGVQRIYRFGPNSQLWVWALWQIMRYPFEWRVVVKLNTDWTSEQMPTLAPHNEGLFQYVINCGILNSTYVPELLEILGRLLRQYTNLSLLAVPDSFLYLNRQPVFQQFALEHRHHFNLMSWMWEPFFARQELQRCGVHFSDAMIDWATGLNFFTCRAGYQHTCPIFARNESRLINLLNLMPPPGDWGIDDEDVFKAVDVERCECGANRLLYTFIPHQSVAMQTPSGQILYDIGLAERLNSMLQVVQFIQRENRVSVYYKAEGKFLDERLLESYFSNHGFDVRWCPNEVWTIVGPKRIPFLRPPSGGIEL